MPFRAGIAFHVQLDTLYFSAVTWRNNLRIFRLARQRHLHKLQEGVDLINLASLPFEVLNLIETYIMCHESNGQSQQYRPFKAVCECRNFAQDVVDSAEYKQALLDSGAKYVDEEDKWGLAEIERDFQRDMIFYGMVEEAEYQHRISGSCKAEEQDEKSWEHLAMDRITLKTPSPDGVSISSDFSLKLY
jgi:hypothetical protein